MMEEASMTFLKRLRLLGAAIAAAGFLTTANSADDFYIEINKDIPDKVLAKLCPTYPCKIFEQRSSAALLTATNNDIGFQRSEFNNSALDYAYDTLDDSGSPNVLTVNRTLLEADLTAAIKILEDPAQFGTEAYEEAQDLFDNAIETDVSNEMLAYALTMAKEFLVAQKSGPYQVTSDEAMDLDPVLAASLSSTIAILTDLETGTKSWADLTPDERQNVLGFWGKIRKSWRKFKRWARRTLKKAFSVGKTELVYLQVYADRRPHIDLANPIVLRDLDVTPKFQIKQYYKLFGKTRHVKIGSSRIGVEIGVSAKLIADKTQGKKLVTAKFNFSRFKIRFKILTWTVRVGLTSLANKLVDKKPPIAVFDASKLLAPFDPLKNGVGVVFGIHDFDIPVDPRALKIRIDLLVK